MINYLTLIMFLVMGWAFFGFVVFVSHQIIQDRDILIEQVDCEILKELDIYFEHWKTKEYVLEECYS